MPQWPFNISTRTSPKTSSILCPALFTIVYRFIRLLLKFQAQIKTFVSTSRKQNVRCKHFQPITYSETVTAELFWALFQSLHKNYQSYPGCIKVTPHIKVTPVDGNVIWSTQNPVASRPYISPLIQNELLHLRGQLRFNKEYA